MFVTHVYMIPLWMIVCVRELWGWVLHSFPSCIPFLFFFLLPRSFMGGLVLSLFFGGYRSKCRAINYSFFSSLGFGFLYITYKHWFWVWDFGLTFFVSHFPSGRREEERRERERY